MIQKFRNALNHRVVFLFFMPFLCLAMFPSWLSLSKVLKVHYPDLFSQLGPLNPVKMIFPILFLWLLFHFGNLTKRLFWSLFLFIFLGTFFTILSGRKCIDPSLHYREWAAIAVGLLTSVALVQFPLPYLKTIVRFWVGTIALAVILNLFFPATLNHLNRIFFDPTRLVSDETYGVTLLNGFYDIGSMAKLLMWCPWVWLWAESIGDESPFTRKRFAIFCVLFTTSLSLILLTTQRGPMVALVGGIIVYFLFRSIARKEYRAIGILAGTLFILVSSALFFMPNALYERRIQPLFSLHKMTEESMQSNPNMSSLRDRLHIYQVSLSVVKSHPMGLACIPDEYFIAADASPGTHSHNVFLQQTRSRGWIWGFLNLIFWLQGFVLLARKKSEAAFLALGGLSSTILLSLVDYPWFVLNHAILMGIFLFGALVLEERKALLRLSE